MFFNKIGTYARKVDLARFRKKQLPKAVRNEKRKARRLARRLNRR